MSTRLNDQVGLIAQLYMLAMLHIIHNNHPTFTLQLSFIQSITMDLFPDTIDVSDTFDNDGASLSMFTTTGSNDLELPPVNHTANNSSQSSDSSWMDGILSPTAGAPSVSSNSKKFEIMKFFDSKNITFLSDSNGRITIDSSGSNNDVEILDYCRSRGSVMFSGDKIIIDTNANHGGSFDGALKLGGTVANQSAAAAGKVSPFSTESTSSSQGSSTLVGNIPPMPPPSLGEGLLLNCSQCKICEVNTSLLSDKKTAFLDPSDVTILSSDLLVTNLNYRNSGLNAVHICCPGCREAGFFLHGGISTPKSRKALVRHARKMHKQHMKDCANLKKKPSGVSHSNDSSCEQKFVHELLELNKFEDSHKGTRPIVIFKGSTKAAGGS